MRGALPQPTYGPTMCGIAGWFGWDLPQDERLFRLKAMCASMRHRGPDDEGFFVDSDVALGMQRLSILDIQGGHQPMYGAGRTVTLVFNGEIYNHEELRRGMQREGQCFHSHSDTEVILKTYEERGILGFEAFNGMFAIAIWDGRARALHLVRDRMGIKPLYYSWDGKRLLFGSEIKAILASGAVEARVDQKALWDYLTFRYVPGPHSIWQGIRKLPPGHHMLFSPGMREPRIERYWDIPYRHPSRQLDDTQADEEFETLLANASNLRMLADVPVGILLSGGLDSSVVAALASRRGSGPVKTFSVAFAGAGAIDERPFAREVAKHLGTDHHEVVIDAATFRDSLSDFVYHTDEPLADLASVPLLHVCRLASEHVKVVLSGEGSDEILGGYDLELHVRCWQEESRRPGRWGRLLDRIMPRPAKDFRHVSTPFTMTNYVNSQTKKHMLRHADGFPDSLDPLRQSMHQLGKQDPLHQVLYSLSQHWLVEDLLMKADRMSMACSLELRTPFLDYRLVEWAAQVSARLKVGPDANGALTSKRVLRRLGADLLPSSIVERPKMGFPVPVYGWLSGPLRDLAQDLLGSSNARCRRWIRTEALVETIAKGTDQSAHILDQHRLWNLMILEEWARRWRA